MRWMVHWPWIHCLNHKKYTRLNAGKHIVCQYFRWKFSVSKRDVDKYSPFLIFDKDDRHEINQIADVLVLYLLVLNAEFFSLILHL